MMFVVVHKTLTQIRATYRQQQTSIEDTQAKITEAATKKHALDDILQLKQLEKEHLQQTVDEIASKLSQVNQSDDRELSKLRRQRQKAAERRRMLDTKVSAAEKNVQRSESERDFIMEHSMRLLSIIRDGK